MTSASVTRLTTDRLEEAVALARAVGWPDVLEDWRVVHAAGHVLSIDGDDGTLAAVGALADFGALAFVGKMIVRPEQQRRGLGRLMLRHCVELAKKGAVVGLCATDAGRPLYERNGFQEAGTVRILRGRLGSQENAEKLASIEETNLDRVLSLDRVATGCDRAAMLRAKLAESVASACHIDDAGECVGFAIATKQGALTMLGPVIANGTMNASALVAAVAPREGDARIDVEETHIGFWHALLEMGFTEAGSRTMMTLDGSPFPGRREHVFGLAAQAFG